MPKKDWSKGGGEKLIDESATIARRKKQNILIREKGGEWGKV